MLIGGDDLRGFSAADSMENSAAVGSPSPLFWLTGTACKLPAEAKRCFGRRPTRLFMALSVTVGLPPTCFALLLALGVNLHPLG